MDLSQPVSLVGVADQCVAVLCDSAYFAVVVFDVAAVPEADLHQSVMLHRIYRILHDSQDKSCTSWNILLILSKARAAQHTTGECCRTLSLINTNLPIHHHIINPD